jgi:hypothetical protein
MAPPEEFPEALSGVQRHAGVVCIPNGMPDQIVSFETLIVPSLGLHVRRRK